MNYLSALYRKDNYGRPCIWYAEVVDKDHLSLTYGIMGKTLTTDIISTGKRSSMDDLKSRITAKRKNGYLFLTEVKDHTSLPVEEASIIHFLTTYLPTNRSTADGNFLLMLAKLYDNSNGKMFKDEDYYIIQPKINGLRCAIGATTKGSDIFHPTRLIFKSREGTIWESLDNLEDYLLKHIPDGLLKLMIEEDYWLDGELYIPQTTVNDVNHYVKDRHSKGNKLLQYWCYDLAIPNMLQDTRLDLLEGYLIDYEWQIRSKEDHYAVDNRLVLVESFKCNSHSSAVNNRDQFIEWGFEGEIGRKRKAEYQFGKRNSTMWKFKSTSDGIFTIVDIVPEGERREDLPLLVIRNDVNNATFKAHITGSHNYQRHILLCKTSYIGKKILVEYGERSGVDQVPFHVKSVTFVEQ